MDRRWRAADDGDPGDCGGDERLTSSISSSRMLSASSSLLASTVMIMPMRESFLWRLRHSDRGRGSLTFTSSSNPEGIKWSIEVSLTWRISGLGGGDGMTGSWASWSSLGSVRNSSMMLLLASASIMCNSEHGTIHSSNESTRRGGSKEISSRFLPGSMVLHVLGGTMGPTTLRGDTLASSAASSSKTNSTPIGESLCDRAGRRWSSNKGIPERVLYEEDAMEGSGW